MAQTFPSLTVVTSIMFKGDDAVTKNRMALAMDTFNRLKELGVKIVVIKAVVPEEFLSEVNTLFADSPESLVILEESELKAGGPGGGRRMGMRVAIGEDNEAFTTESMLTPDQQLPQEVLQKMAETTKAVMYLDIEKNLAATEANFAKLTNPITEGRNDITVAARDSRGLLSMNIWQREIEVYENILLNWIFTHGVSLVNTADGNVVQEYAYTSETDSETFAAKRAAEETISRVETFDARLVEAFRILDQLYAAAKTGDETALAELEASLRLVMPYDSLCGLTVASPDAIRSEYLTNNGFYWDSTVMPAVIAVSRGLSVGGVTTSGFFYDESIRETEMKTPGLYTKRLDQFAYIVYQAYQQIYTAKYGAERAKELAQQSLRLELRHLMEFLDVNSEIFNEINIDKPAFNQANQEALQVVANLEEVEQEYQVLAAKDIRDAGEAARLTELKQLIDLATKGFDGTSETGFRQIREIEMRERTALGGVR